MKLRILCVLLLSGANVACADIAVHEAKGKVRVEIDGALFTEYNYQSVARPFLYPVIGPGGASMTRDWPMVKTGGDTTDHVHHKGLWFAHGSVNGVDFWSEQKAYGKTVHQTFLALTSGEKEGVIRTLNAWVAPSGTVVCTDERLIRFRSDKEVREIDYEITLIASHGTLTLGDTKEGTMAIRLPTTLSVSGTRAQGHIVTSEGARDGEAWGKPANWVDTWGPVDGKTVGVAIFDHPSNPRHPTRWHVRTYGLFAANPFGLKPFDKKAKESGDLTLAPGGRVTFRYRFVLHAGDAQAARIAERYTAYSAQALTH
jgi:hypothetical protein